MSEPDNFISRWSRRKAAVAEQDAAPTKQDVAPTATPDSNEDPSAEKTQSSVPAPAEKVSPPPAIDLSTLPPIESIVAGTDISAFLRAGVPTDLTRAALRRAWAADPTIRDFIGLSENSWDFTAPDGIPGFGPLSTEEAGRVMAQLTSSAKDIAGKARDAIERINALDPPTEPDQAKLSPSESRQVPRADDGTFKRPASPEQDQSEQKPAAIADASNSLQRDKENIAAQHTQSASSDSSPTRRAHGSALPD
jgi:uncharacterized protein DUF3306